MIQILYLMEKSSKKGQHLYQRRVQNLYYYREQVKGNHETHIQQERILRIKITIMNRFQFTLMNEAGMPILESETLWGVEGFATHKQALDEGVALGKQLFNGPFTLSVNKKVKSYFHDCSIPGWYPKPFSLN